MSRLRMEVFVRCGPRPPAAVGASSRSEPRYLTRSREPGHRDATAGVLDRNTRELEPKSDNPHYGNKIRHLAAHPQATTRPPTAPDSSRSSGLARAHPIRARRAPRGARRLPRVTAPRAAARRPTFNRSSEPPPSGAAARLRRAGPATALRLLRRSDVAFNPRPAPRLAPRRLRPEHEPDTSSRDRELACHTGSARQPRTLLEKPDP